MAYTGRATFDDSDSIGEDVSPIVTIISPLETPLLSYLGNPLYPATNTKHEFLTASANAFTDPLAEDLDNSETGIDVTDGTKFVAGMIIQIDDELMIVASVATNTLTVSTRPYGSSTAATHSTGATVTIVGWPALEGADAAASRNTSRTRAYNYTQIFAETVDVSGTEIAVNQIGVANEYEWQKQLRTAELLRQLELAVMRSSLPAATPQGSSSVRRTMKGIQYTFSTNSDNASSATLTKDILDGYIRDAWTGGARGMNLIVANAFQKSKIDGFLTSARRYGPMDQSIKTLVDVYHTSFGHMDVMLNHNVPNDEVWMLDTSLIKVLPLQGRSFQHVALGKTGDAQRGQIVGEYTLEMKNEAGHARVYGLATS